MQKPTEKPLKECLLGDDRYGFLFLGVGTKPGLWTLDWSMDWTMDWTLDWTMDSILDSIGQYLVL